MGVDDDQQLRPCLSFCRWVVHPGRRKDFSPSPACSQLDEDAGGDRGDVVVIELIELELPGSTSTC